MCSPLSSYLVPRHKDVLLLGFERTLSELNADGAASVDHEVEPAVALRHRVTLAVQVVVSHPHPDEAATRLGHHAAADDGRPAAKFGVKFSVQPILKYCKSFMMIHARLKVI